MGAAADEGVRAGVTWLRSVTRTASPRTSRRLGRAPPDPPFPESCSARRGRPGAAGRALWSDGLPLAEKSKILQARGRQAGLWRARLTVGLRQAQRARKQSWPAAWSAWSAGAAHSPAAVGERKVLLQHERRGTARAPRARARGAKAADLVVGGAHGPQDARVARLRGGCLLVELSPLRPPPLPRPRPPAELPPPRGFVAMDG